MTLSKTFNATFHEITVWGDNANEFPVVANLHASDCRNIRSCGGFTQTLPPKGRAQLGWYTCDDESQSCDLIPEATSIRWK